MLSNAGLVYFKVEEMKKESDLEPKNFKPLTDFVCLSPCLPSDKAAKGRKYSFRIIFAAKGIVSKSMLLAAPTQRDRDEWVKALRLTIIDMFEARSKLFEKKLLRDGVQVPRGTMLISLGDKALNEIVQVPSQEILEAVMSEGESGSSEEETKNN